MTLILTQELRSNLNLDSESNINSELGIASDSSIDTSFILMFYSYVDSNSDSVT